MERSDKLNNNGFTLKQGRGVTLIELMLALAISTILLLGVGSVYYNSKRTYNVQEEFARLQESSRFALKFLVEDIRMAGYVGCAWNGDLDKSSAGTNNFESFLNENDPPTVDENYLSDFTVGIEGLEAANSGIADSVPLTGPTAGWDRAIPSVLPNAGTGLPLDGSDILIVRYAASNGARLADNKDAANFRIFDQGEDVTAGTIDCHHISGICENDILLVTDCEKSRLFQVTNLVDNGAEVNVVHAGAGNPGNGKPSWGGASDKYEDFEPEDSFIYRAASFAYYVGQGASGEPALFRKNLRPNTAAEELVEGVENMQILYGIDTDKTPSADPDDTGPEEFGDGIANRYVTADQVNLADDNVVSARISLLIRTGNEIGSKDDAPLVAKTYTLSALVSANGTDVVAPADRRMRKVFTTTVKIRNKGLQ